MIDDKRIRDHQIERASGTSGARALPHPISNDLAAAEGDLIAIGREVLLDLNDQFRIGQSHPVALGRPIQIRVGASGNRKAHLFALPLWPSTNFSPPNSTKWTSFSAP